MIIPVEKIKEVREIVVSAEAKISELMGKKVKIDLHTVERADYFPEKIIQDFVCNAFGVTWQEIMNMGKPREISAARQTYCYLTRKHLNRKVRIIGVDIGRDHTSVSAADKNIKGLLKVKDTLVTDAILKIEEQIKQVII